MRFQTKLTVRYYECDPMGIVHHSNYLRYFECARDEMISLGGYGIEQCQADGITFPVAKAELRFLRPVHSGEIITVTAQVDQIPQAKLIVYQQIINSKGEVCCEGVVKLGFLSAATGRPTRCPEKLAAALMAAEQV